MSHHDPLDALIATAKAQDLPPEGAQDEAWAAFTGSLGGGGGDGGAGGGTAAGGSTGVGLVAKVALGVVFAGAVAVGGARWVSPEPDVVSSPELSVAPVVVSEPAPAVPEVAVSTPPVAAAVSPSPQPVSVAPARPRPVRSPDTPLPAESTSTLAEEARLVGAAWKALDGGDARRAFSLAQSHGVRFKGGPLSLEARGAALAARCVLGRPTDLGELESVTNAATPAVVKKISRACGKKP